MKKINFKEFKVFLDITHENSEIVDVRKILGDIVYKNGNGIASLDLAMRIFKSEGEVELTAEDISPLESIINQVCTPIFIDSFKNNIHE